MKQFGILTRRARPAPGGGFATRDELVPRGRLAARPRDRCRRRRADRCGWFLQEAVASGETLTGPADLRRARGPDFLPPESKRALACDRRRAEPPKHARSGDVPLSATADGAFLERRAENDHERRPLPRAQGAARRAAAGGQMCIRRQLSARLCSHLEMKGLCASGARRQALAARLSWIMGNVGGGLAPSPLWVWWQCDRRLFVVP